MGPKNTKIRITISHTKWYHKLFDKFKLYTPEGYYEVGEINFKIIFDKRGKLIESSSEIEIGKNVTFTNKKIGKK